MAKHWEYLVLSFGEMSDPQIEAMLGRHGEMGWELVAVTYGNSRAFLKRVTAAHQETDDIGHHLATANAEFGRTISALLP